MTATPDGIRTVACPRCPTVWHQAGNRTGHCSNCHRTFSGTSAFDAHQTINAGRVTCHDPATQRDRNGALRWRADTDRCGALVWRSTSEYPDKLRHRR